MLVALFVECIAVSTSIERVVVGSLLMVDGPGSCFSGSDVGGVLKEAAVVLVGLVDGPGSRFSGSDVVGALKEASVVPAGLVASVVGWLSVGASILGEGKRIETDVGRDAGGRGVIRR